jgi:hypothetical protein
MKGRTPWPALAFTARQWRDFAVVIMAHELDLA